MRVSLYRDLWMNCTLTPFSVYVCHPKYKKEDYWFARIDEVRLRSSKEVYAIVRWYYNKKHVKDLKKTLPRECVAISNDISFPLTVSLSRTRAALAVLGDTELMFSDHKDVIDVDTVQGTFSNVRFYLLR